MHHSVFLIPIILIILIAGCTSPGDPAEIAKSNNIVENFLEDYPQAEIRTTHFDQRTIRNIIDDIHRDCNSTNITLMELYRVEIEDLDTGMNVITWIDAVNVSILCVVSNRACGNDICEVGESIGSCPSDCTPPTNQTVQESSRSTIYQGSSEDIVVGDNTYEVTLLNVDNNTAIIHVAWNGEEYTGEIEEGVTVTIGFLNIYATEVVFRGLDSASNFIAIEAWSISEDIISSNCEDNRCIVLEGETVIVDMEGISYSISNLGVYDTENAVISINNEDSILVEEHESYTSQGLYLFVDEINYFPRERDVNSIVLLLDLRPVTECSGDTCTIVEGEVVNKSINKTKITLFWFN